MLETQKAGGQMGDREKRLLVVVDGDGAHLYYTSMLLQRLDYNIHTTKSAEDTLEIIEVANPALVLTELSLSGMDGLELMRKIKRNPRTYSIPVIMHTSSSDPSIRETCLRDGCTAFFKKPVEPDILYAAIQKATEVMPRQYIRLNTCLNVLIGDARDATHSLINDYISALSEHGLFVSTSKPKPIGIEIPITIFLENSQIKVDGLVLYSFERGKGPLKTPGMGIKFVHITPEDQQLIKSFIRKEITKGLTIGQLGGTIF